MSSYNRDMKATLIITVLNEEKTIQQLLQSIAEQTRLPNEIIIVDGGSFDKTKEIIECFVKNHAELHIRLLSKKGNRSIGRNEAISNAVYDIIACTDAGCILDKQWFAEIIAPLENKQVDIVSGYYAGKPHTLFQQCLVPYVLVMPDRVNPEYFLPATRSMAMRKTIWEKVGEFDEKYACNEDYVFSKKLGKAKARIVFQQSAVVYWIPRNSVKDAFTMFYRFAYGDAYARIYRPKVLFLITRYLLGLFLIVLAIWQPQLVIVLFACFFLYICWAIAKNFRYVPKAGAIVLLPYLQFLSDIAVLWGTARGMIDRMVQ